MSPENGQKTADPHTAGEVRSKIDQAKTGDKAAASDDEAGGHRPAPETEIAPGQEAQPTDADPLQQYYAEASLTKKITVFALTTAAILIALGAIYTYWPHGVAR